MKKFWHKESGQALVEYGIIISLVAIVLVISLVHLSSKLTEKYNTLGNSISYEQSENTSYRITTSDGISILSTLGRIYGSYTGSEKNITISKNIDGNNLKEIYQDVFKGKNLTTVIFESGINLNRIHARAFQNNKLSSIVLPDSLERIDLYAFRNNNLTEITIPPNVNTIEQLAFYDNNITKVTIGNKVTTIGTDIFSNNTEKFKTAYTEGGAGTYVYVDGNWVKQ